jgi:hypothetical protein
MGQLKKIVVDRELYYFSGKIYQDNSEGCPSEGAGYVYRVFAE